MIADASATITALGTLVAAIGAFLVSVVGAAVTWRKARNVQEIKDAALSAQSAAVSAQTAAEESKAEIIATKDGVYELGKRVDGRLTQLLAATTKAATAEGRAQGRADERAEPGRTP